MRIAHVIDSMEIGGAEMMVRSLCQQHAREGHDLSVHCLFEIGALGEALRQEGIPVMVHGPASYGRMSARMWAAFRRLRPDLVHCHNVVASVVGAPAGRLSGAGVLATRHGIVSRPRNLRRQGLFWLAARAATHVVAVCSRAQENLSRATFAQPRKLRTIYNGASPAFCSTTPVPKTGFTGIMVARLAPPKDFATLLRAAALAIAAVPDLQLWLIGAGPDAPELRRLSAELGLGDRVLFAGQRNDVGSWLARADFFVLSSLSEGVPISLLEALAAGLPPIVTGVGGMPEIARLCAGGRIVPAGDAAELASTLAEFSRNRDRLPGWGRAARELYLERFTLEHMAAEYMKLYETDLPPGRRIVPRQTLKDQPA